MKLSKVLEGVDYIFRGEEIDKEIKGLFHNSKEVKSGGMFFAIPGINVNGSNFVNEAVRNGAKVIVSSSYLDVPDEVINIVTDDVRKAMSLASNNFFGKPSQDMFVIGVTGTNGKTTSTFMLESIFKEAGQKVGVIGTNGIFIDGKKYNSDFTTPDPIILHKALAKMKREGVDVVVMEVSAHALALQKIRGVMTDIALFTNLTQDHLDFFKNMDDYADTKASFFTDGYARFGVVNLDDEVGREIFERSTIPVLTYSREKLSYGNEILRNADIIAKNEKHNINNQRFIVNTPKGEESIELNLAGGFNVSNALGVISAGLMAGIDLKTIALGLKKLQKVDGRFNTYDVNGVRVIIDYAHTPDGLQNILKSAREITKGRVVSVFGCGGNRDSLKRPVMGQISEELADFTIITSDNPRFEDPEEIAKQIEKGMRRTAPYSIVLDRKEAINHAINIAKRGDTVVIAGKGAEPYIDQNGIKTPYEDRKVVEEIISENLNESNIY